MSERTMSSNVRKEILVSANNCVNGNREQDYGTPENNFLRLQLCGRHI